MRKILSLVLFLLLLGWGVTEADMRINPLTGELEYYEPFTILDNGVAPGKLQSSSGVPDNTTAYFGDGSWRAPSLNFQSQLDGKQNLDEDLTVLSFPTNWRLFISNGVNAITEIAFGDNNTFFRSNGPNALPTWGAGTVSDNVDEYPTFNQNTTGNAATATALGSNGANCPAGQAPLGVDNVGAVEGCWTPAASLDNTTMDNTVIGATTPAPVHASTLDATGHVDLLSTASSGGIHTFQGGSVHNDNQDASFGTSSNYKQRYDPTTKQLVQTTTDNGSTMTDTDAAYLQEFSSAGPAAEGQRVRGVKVNGSYVEHLDKGGNHTIIGTYQGAGLQSNCSYDNGTCLYNSANVGRPSDNTAGNEGYDNTAKEKVVSVDGVWRYAQYDAIAFVIGGGDNTITTGEKGHVEVPFPCDIQSIRLFADASGSIVVDLWKDTYANFPPTVADNVTGTGTKPTLSSEQKSELTDFTDYTTITFAAGDIIAYNVDSVNTVKRVTVSIRVRK